MTKLTARIQRLEQQAPPTSAFDVATMWALQQVSDTDLALLAEVARAQQNAGPDAVVPFTPEQWAALDRFNAFRQLAQ
ncbi:MAG: hypothetical protein HY690_15355 [Chloroflexi bacterium]|nr:hypothetical protein [Chloroflexota bacterium]